MSTKPPIKYSVKTYVDMTDCIFHFIGMCMHNEKCPFRHVNPYINSEDELEDDSGVDMKKICDKWLIGQCANKHCHFRHPSQKFELPHQNHLPIHLLN